MQPRCEQDERPIGVGDIQTEQRRVVHEVQRLRILEAAVSSELPDGVSVVLEAKRLEEAGQVSLGRSSESVLPSRLLHPAAGPPLVLKLLEEGEHSHHEANEAKPRPKSPKTTRCVGSGRLRGQRASRMVKEKDMRPLE